MYMKTIFIILLMLFPLYSQADGYQLGRGLSLYEKDGFLLNLGGHLSLRAEGIESNNPTLKSNIGVENAGIMLYGEGSKYLSFLLEYGNEALWNYNEDRSETNDPVLRRGYVDIHLDTMANLKLGRFLTPIGIYNPTYINALRWSNIRPLVAQNFFPDIITGAQLHGLLGTDIEYAIFTQLNDDEDVAVSHLPISEFSGGELRYLFGINSRVALNYGTFKSNTLREICQFGGANVLYEWGDNEFSSEFLYKRGKWPTLNTQYNRWEDLSWYAQYVQNLVPQQYLSLRVGQKKREGEGVGSWDEQNGILGYIYRTDHALSYKAEYRYFERSGMNAYHTNELHLSFSVLF